MHPYGKSVCCSQNLAARSVNRVQQQLLSGSEQPFEFVVLNRALPDRHSSPDVEAQNVSGIQNRNKK